MATGTPFRIGFGASSPQTALVTGTFYAPLGGSSKGQNALFRATEAQVQWKAPAGVASTSALSNFGIRNTRSLTGTNTVNVQARKNAAAFPTAPSVSYQMGQTGTFEDTIDVGTFTAGDLLNYVITAATMSTSFYVDTIYCTLQIDTTSAGVGYTPLITLPYQATNAGATTYQGVADVGPTANVLSPEPKFFLRGNSVSGGSSTIKVEHLSFYCMTNGTSSVCTYTIRKNAVDTALTASTGAGTTGRFEDVSHSFTGVAGDYLTVKLVTGGTKNTFQASIFQVSVDYTGMTATMVAAYNSGGVDQEGLWTGTNYYWATWGSAYQAFGPIDPAIAATNAFTMKNLQAYCGGGQSATITAYLRKGTNTTGGPSVSMAGSGFFEDTTGTISIASGDTFGHYISNPGTFGSIYRGHFLMEPAAGPVTQQVTVAGSITAAKLTGAEANTAVKKTTTAGTFDITRLTAVVNASLVAGRSMGGTISALQLASVLSTLRLPTVIVGNRTGYREKLMSLQGTSKPAFVYTVHSGAAQFVQDMPFEAAVGMQYYGTTYQRNSSTIILGPGLGNNDHNWGVSVGWFAGPLTESDPSTSYMHVPRTKNTNTGSQHPFNGTVTLILWFKRSYTPGLGTAVFQTLFHSPYAGGSFSYGQGFLARIRGDNGKLEIITGNPANAAAWTSTNAVPLDTNWHMMVLTGGAIYLDGSAFAGTGSWSFSAQVEYFVGATYDNVNDRFYNGFGGYLANFSEHDSGYSGTPMSAADVAALWTAGTTLTGGSAQLWPYQKINLLWPFRYTGTEILAGAVDIVRGKVLAGALTAAKLASTLSKALAISLSSTYDDAVLAASGLLAYYKFDEPDTWPVVIDFSGNGKHGTRVGTTPKAAGVMGGNRDRAWTSNGASTFVGDANNHADFPNVIKGLTAWTMVTVQNINSNTNMTFWAGNTTGYPIYGCFSNSHQINPTSASGGKFLGTNTFSYLLVITYDGTNLRSYIGTATNFNPSATSTVSSVAVGGDDVLRIAGGALNSWGIPNGAKVDNLAFYNRVLTSSEITALIKGRFGLPRSAGASLWMAATPGILKTLSVSGTQTAAKLLAALTNRRGKVLDGTITPTGTSTSPRINAVNLAGSLAGRLVGDRVARVNKVLAGAFTSTTRWTGAIKKLPARSNLAGALTAVKLTGAQVSVKVALLAPMAGSIAPAAANVVLTTVKQLGGAFTSTTRHTGALNLVKPLSTLAGNLTAAKLTAALVSRRVFSTPLLSGAVTPAATLVKLVKRGFSGRLDTGFTSTLVQRIARSVAGSLHPTGKTVRLSPRAMAGLLHPTATLAKLTTKTQAGTLSTSAALVRLAARVLGGSAAPTATLQRSARRAFLGAITPNGILDQVRRRVVSAAGTLSPSGAVARRTARAFSSAMAPTGALARTLLRSGLQATIAPTAVLVRQARRLHAAALNPAAALAKAVTHTHAGATQPTGTTTRRTAKTAAGATTPTAALAKAVSAVRSGGIGPTGTLVRFVPKAFAGTVLPTGAAGMARALRSLTVAVAGTLGLAATLTRRKGTLLAANLAPTATTALRWPRTVGGTLAPAGTVVRRPLRLLAGLVVPTGTLVRRAVVARGGTLAAAGAVVRVPVKRLEGYVLPVASLATRQLKALVGVLSSSGSLAATRVTRTVGVILGGTLDLRGALARATTLRRGGTLAPTATLARGATRSVAAILAPAGRFTLRRLATLAATLAPTGLGTVARLAFTRLRGLIHAGDRPAGKAGIGDRPFDF